MPANALHATEFGRHIYRVSTAWRREIDQRVRAFGLTEATWRPILYLGRLGDGQRQTDLATALMIEAASLVRLVDLLERSGLVERLEDPDDRRSKRVWMTEAGRETFAKVNRVHQSLAEELVRDVSADELALCDSVLRRILAATAHEPAPAESPSAEGSAE
jgi:MarR family transcriptional regulator for hemolysin